MGQNSTEVAHRFGQFGSAFADASANTITPPEELCIIAIQFLADTSLSALTAKDANVFPTIGAAANDNGHYTRTVDGATSSSTKVIFDQENAGTGNNDNIEVGDEIYLTSTGASLGVVAGLDPDGDNTKEITISASVAITNDETLVFKRPNDQYVNGIGVGGLTIANDNAFPAGSTIYGRWDSVSMQSDDTDGGIIVYFGE